MTNKPRIVKDYVKLDETILEQIKLQYPYGFEKDLILFKNQHNKLISALPFETEDRYYLIRMTRAEALEIIKDDDDFDSDGVLKDDVKEELELKYEDIEDVEDVEDDD